MRRRVVVAVVWAGCTRRSFGIARHANGGPKGPPFRISSPRGRSLATWARYHAVYPFIMTELRRSTPDTPSRLANDERYRVLADTAPDAIVTVDADSIILSVNPATEKIFGWTADEMLGKSLTMLMPERMRERHRAGMSRYLQSGKRKLDWRSVALPGVKKNGEEFPMEVSFGEFVDAGQHIFSGFMRDVSERAAHIAVIEQTTGDLTRALAELETRVREAEEARRAADAANATKAQFLRTMSHELRTPLNAIGGFVELLEIGVRGPVSPAQLEDLARIHSAQARLLDLINDILDFAKLEQGEVTYDIQELLVSDVLCSTRAMIEPQLVAKRIEFVCETKSDGVRISADLQKLEQILLNLLSNAVKFTPEAGRITVSSTATGETVDLIVEDNGPGIALNRQAAVFEPFTQVDAALTRKHGGSGLGLSISRELARGMGGSIALESTPGRGSTFTVRLPRGKR